MSIGHGIIIALVLGAAAGTLAGFLVIVARAKGITWL
jgi:hypothetical protein